MLVAYYAGEFFSLNGRVLLFCFLYLQHVMYFVFVHYMVNPSRYYRDFCFSQDLRKLISQCWHADVDRRPNFRVITERLRHLYQGEKQSSKLCMSALNLNEGEHPKLRGGALCMLHKCYLFVSAVRALFVARCVLYDTRYDLV